MVLRGDTPRPAPEGDGRAQPPRGGGLRARLRGGQPARERGHAALLERARPRHHHAAGQGPGAARWCPSVFGYDPRFQFVHEADVVRAILFVLEGSVQGIYNVAGDGLLPWSEVAAICGKRTVPLPPFGLGLLSAPLTRLGLDLPPELLDLLRHGRGVDNRRLKQHGIRLPLHVGRHGRRLRGGAPPPDDDRPDRDRLPVRTRRRAVLPPLPRRRRETGTARRASWRDGGGVGAEAPPEPPPGEGWLRHPRATVVQRRPKAVTEQLAEARRRRRRGTTSSRSRTSARVRTAGCRSRSRWRCRRATGSRGCCGSRWRRRRCR